MKDHKLVTLYRAGDNVYLDDNKNTLGVFQAANLTKQA